jgi:pimeloyl-ACP methyl ester carboxylesterase
MADTVSGFPFWKLEFNEDGQPEHAATFDTFISEVRANNLSDLFVFSHGWNNDPPTAMRMYQLFFAEMRKLLDDPNTPKRRAATIGTAGIIWPSIRWPEEEASASTGGAASLNSSEERNLFEELKKVFKTEQQCRILDELALMLERKQRSEAALKQFKVKLGQLIQAPRVNQSSQDNLEQRGVLANDDNWREVFDALADEEPSEQSPGGAAGLGDMFSRLWSGATGALRNVTYWQMKERAGVVGMRGLGPLIGRLHEAAADLRVHLLGHSFGARLVSYALAGLPNRPAGAKSPVKSLFLLQGAFSHFAFADALPFDRTRKGDLAGMGSRVDGPLLTTHSLKDLAVGAAYPLASVVAGQDAADQADILFRWGSMGHDGAQAVNAKQVQLAKAGTAYEFETGKWQNLDGNKVIIAGGPPSGAHSDIIHPHTAWATLAAAGIGASL